MAEKIKVGTRGSRLALVQAREFAERLHSRGICADLELVVINADGDEGEFSAQGAFTGALERALIDGRVDCAVHSFKDLPLKLLEGTEIAACLPRASIYDTIISRKQEALKCDRLRVGTSSRRRVAELGRCFPGWEFFPIRGNVDTRIRMLSDGVGELDAIVLARAGLDRLGVVLQDFYVEDFSLKVILPSPGQGCVVVQCLIERRREFEIFSTLDDFSTRECVFLEKYFLECLGGGCGEPFGCLVEKCGESYEMQARWYRQDGRFFQTHCTACDSEEVKNLIKLRAQEWLIKKE